MTKRQCLVPYLQVNLQELDTGTLVEICEENVIIGSNSFAEAGAGTMALLTPNIQLLTAAGYTIEGAGVYIHLLTIINKILRLRSTNIKVPEDFIY